MKNRESMTAGTVAGLLVAAVLVAGFAARAETYYANGGGNGSPCSPRDSQESSPTPQFKSINKL